MLRYYYMDISSGCSFEQSQLLSGILPKDRIEKKDRYRDYGMAQRSMVTSAFMQYGIADALDIPITRIGYCYGPQGKPLLGEESKQYLLDQGKTGDVYFNLSHSGKHAVFVVSDEPVGIDVECGKKQRLKVAKRCFCVEEYEDIISAGSEEEQDERFLLYWTMKEAFIKRDGRGMSIPLNSFCICRRENELSYVIDEERKERLHFRNFYPEKRCCVSICGKELISFDVTIVTIEDIIHKMREE